LKEWSLGSGRTEGKCLAGNFNARSWLKTTDTRGDKRHGHTPRVHTRASSVKKDAQTEELYTEITPRRPEMAFSNAVETPLLLPPTWRRLAERNDDKPTVIPLSNPSLRGIVPSAANASAPLQHNTSSAQPDSSEQPDIGPIQPCVMNFRSTSREMLMNKYLSLRVWANGGEESDAKRLPAVGDRATESVNKKA
jgi:hypothetical protein